LGALPARHRGVAGHYQQMSTVKIGRNDPCPCGSGKKYKRCCLAADEEREATRPETNPPVEAPDPAPALPDVRRLPELLQAYARLAPKGERGEIRRMAAELQPVLAYMERQPAIEDACHALEAHRAEFEKLAKDEKAIQKRARELFAEERFKPLRFTAKDIQRAFDQVGRPGNTASNDRFVETVRAAILCLADKSRRNDLSMSLLLSLPDYVAAGRHLDGWIIQDCAYLTTEAPDESNPFLFEMFCQGYEAWADEQRAGDQALFREVGLDLPRTEDITMEELEAWLQTQQADPTVRAKLEAFMRAHPEQEALARSNFEEMRHNSIQILEREDAGALLLSFAEIEPWLPRLSERMAEFIEPSSPGPGSTPPSKADERAQQAIVQLFREMAGAIFTPERRQELVSRLKTYRNERFAAGDRRTATLVHGAITYVEPEDEPDKNTFLICLCHTSIHKCVEAMAGAPPEEQP
jgi:hypothetical protein